MYLYQLFAGASEWVRKAEAKYSVRSQGNLPYGELLFASRPTNDSIGDAVKSWMAEAALYDYNRPGYSEKTADFTQLVWKSSTQVGCAQDELPAGTEIAPAPSTFVVCRYSPAGNTASDQFAANVGRPRAQV